MDGLFTPSELLAYLHGQYGTSSPTKLLSLYVRAMEKCSDRTEDTLQIKLEYLRILSKFDSFQTKQNYRILRQDYWKSKTYWSEYFRYECQNKTEEEFTDRVLRRAKELVNMRIFEGKDDLLKFMDEYKYSREDPAGLGPIRSPDSAPAEACAGSPDRGEAGAFSADPICTLKFGTSPKDLVERNMKIKRGDSLQRSEQRRRAVCVLKEKNGSHAKGVDDVVVSTDGRGVITMRMDVPRISIDESALPTPEERHDAPAKYCAGAAEPLFSFRSTLLSNTTAPEKAPAAAGPPGDEHGTYGSFARVPINGADAIVTKLVANTGNSKVYQVIYKGGVCALKSIRLRPDNEKVIMNEIRLLKKLQGKDGIINLLDYEISAERIQIILEYGEVSLGRLIKGELSLNFIRDIWEQMLVCVKIVHSEKIIHKDLKPDNFLFVRGRVKLIDFGISNEMRHNSTKINNDNWTGTLGYMSPESLLGSRDLGRSTDVWSLGCILYEMVYKRVPFEFVGNPLKNLRMYSESNFEVEYPDTRMGIVVETIKQCLVFDKDKRAKIDDLLADGIGVVVSRAEIERLRASAREGERRVRQGRRLVSESQRTGEYAGDCDNDGINEILCHIREGKENS